MKTCSHPNCNYPVFSKELCKYHIPKKNIKKVSVKQAEKKIKKKELLEEDKQFYAGIWDKREHNCYNCGKGIYECTTVNFHHILEKRNYPKLRHVEENIVILCWQCHSKVETMLSTCPKVEELTKEIKLKYD